jgi:transposase
VVGQIAVGWPRSHEQVEELEARMIRFDHALIQGLDAWRPHLVLLQSTPSIDLMGAAMLLVEIGTDMASFGGAE